MKKFIEKMRNADLMDIGMMICSVAVTLLSLALFIFVIWIILGGYALLNPS